MEVGWQQHSCSGRRSSLEAVEDLTLHAMLDLAPPQHELQDLVDGVLRVFLQDTGSDEGRASHGTPDTPPSGSPGVPCSWGTLQPSHPASLHPKTSSHFLSDYHVPGPVLSLHILELVLSRNNLTQLVL